MTLLLALLLVGTACSLTRVVLVRLARREEARQDRIAAIWQREDTQAIGHRRAA